MKRWLAGLDWAFIIVAVLSIGAAAITLSRDGWDVFIAIFQADLLLFAGILPKVLAGCLIGALIRLLVPREVVARHVGAGSGLRGLIIAAAVGAVFPGGPFTIFPLAAVFLVTGADRGAAVAFVSAWLLLGLNRAIIWEAPFFGYSFVGMRMLISLPMPVLAGWAVRILDRQFPPPRDEALPEPGPKA